jgi:hypothetical protein
MPGSCWKMPASVTNCVPTRRELNYDLSHFLIEQMHDVGCPSLSSVIAGLDPAIHQLRKMLFTKQIDPRVKPAGDVSGWASAASIRSKHT